MSSADLETQTLWNDRYRQQRPNWKIHPFAQLATDIALPSRRVLELAAGTSGSALLLASKGFDVLVVDISNIALDMVVTEATRRKVAGHITTKVTNLDDFCPEKDHFAVVACFNYWDAALFDRASQAVEPGGILAWEAVRSSSDLPPQWTVSGEEPASLLSHSWNVLQHYDVDPDIDHPHPTRRLLAQRILSPSAKKESPT